MVNIAVFATFWPRVGGILLANAAFKPLCAIWPLDMSRYGWQKWQETATIWQGGRQKWQGCETFCRVHAVRLAVAWGAGGVFGMICGASRCWRRGVAPG